MTRRRLLSFLLVPASLAPLACAGGGQPQRSFPTTVVQRGPIEVTASADGVVEPVRTVEVKSKASGEIIKLPVDTGDHVEVGELLVQLLPRDAQNAYDQAQADLEAAQARLDNARIQLQRAKRLHQDGLIPASELETAQLAVTTGESEALRARKALDTAAERLSETTVRAPIDGTVLAKSVEIGQVVSSAVSQVTGGTLLLTLADLSRVQVRSLVDEVDIGRIRTGLSVRISVEAYPDRLFAGHVQKIEPQAVVEQNVTMFPVLTEIDNTEGLLKPGMNADVEILIARRDEALTLPNEALKTPDEARQIATLLGLGAGTRTAGAGGTAVARERPGGDEPAGTQRSAGDRRIVFVPGEKGSYQPQHVTVGLRNWERTEVLSGVAAGQAVALLPSAAQLRQSEEFRQRIQRVRGMPGMSGNRNQPRSSGQ